MINIGLFLLSLSYLLAEYIFNVSIVNVFGSDTAQNYSDVDHVGRLISALGASLLSFRLLINLKIKRKVKIIMILLILPVVGFGVYDLQERLLNYYTKITPMDEKREQAYTYIYKKGISNGSLLNKDLPNDSATTEERMVFNSSLVFWGIGYPEFQNKVLNMSNKEKEKDIELVFRTDFSRNNRYYMTTYRMLDHEIQGLYKGYKFHHERIAEKRRYADREIDKVWDKKLEVEKKLINKYMSVRNSLGKKEEQSLSSLQITSQSISISMLKHV